MWAAGVTLYILLSGKFPFGGDTEKEYYARVLKKQAYFPVTDWAGISEECKNLLRGLLDKDPGRRLTAKQALAHDWFCGVDEMKEKLMTGEQSEAGATPVREESKRKTNNPMRSGVIWKEDTGIGIGKEAGGVFKSSAWVDESEGADRKPGFHGGSLGALGAVMGRGAGNREHLDKIGGKLAPTRSSPTVSASLASRGLLPRSVPRSTSKKKVGWTRTRTLRSKKSQVLPQPQLQQQVELEEDVERHKAERRRLELAKEGQALRGRGWEGEDDSMFFPAPRAEGGLSELSEVASGWNPGEVELAEGAAAPELLPAGIEDGDDCEFFHNHESDRPPSTVLSDLTALQTLPGTVPVMRLGIPPGMTEKDAVGKAGDVKKALGPPTKSVPGVPASPGVVVRDPKTSTIIPFSRNDNTGPGQPAVWQTVVKGEEEALLTPPNQFPPPSTAPLPPPNCAPLPPSNSAPLPPSNTGGVRVARGRIEAVTAARSLSENVSRQDSASQSSGKLQFKGFSRRSSIAHGVTSWGHVEPDEHAPLREAKKFDSTNPHPKKTGILRQFRNARRSNRASLHVATAADGGGGATGNNLSNSRGVGSGMQGPSLKPAKPLLQPVFGGEKKSTRRAGSRRGGGGVWGNKPEAEEGGGAASGTRLGMAFGGRRMGSGRISVGDATSPESRSVKFPARVAKADVAAKDSVHPSGDLDDGKIGRLRFRSFYRCTDKDADPSSGPATSGSSNFSRRAGRKTAPAAAEARPLSALDKLRRASSWRNEQPMTHDDDGMAHPSAWSAATQQALQHLGNENNGLLEPNPDNSYSFGQDPELRPAACWEGPVAPPPGVVAGTGYHKL